MISYLITLLKNLSDKVIIFQILEIRPYGLLKQSLVFFLVESFLLFLLLIYAITRSGYD